VNHGNREGSAMTTSDIDLIVDDDAAIVAFLADRIYEFNSRAIERFDGLTFAATSRDLQGRICAGISGHTWAGCCTIEYLWVEETRRGQGLGTRLLERAEAHARERDCSVVVVATHSFQAPAFYERHRYSRVATVKDQPLGHAHHFYTKYLTTGQ
jgi:GNAT superfamily N-acetyltransferase